MAKARPAQLNYASNGVGSSTHLATEMFVMMAGIRMVHVPYKGLSAATSDLLSRDIAVATKSPDVIERLTFEGVIAVGNSPGEFSAHIKQEFARIGKVVRAATAKFD